MKFWLMDYEKTEDLHIFSKHRNLSTVTSLKVIVFDKYRKYIQLDLCFKIGCGLQPYLSIVIP